mgnify:CR=1 FL=1
MNLLKDKIETLYQKFLWPSLFAAMVTTIYSFVDTIAIGQGVGPDGAAAAAIIYPILGVASLFGFLCGIGGSVRLGNARGEGQLEKANAYYTASLLLVVVTTVIVWPVTAVFKKEIFSLFGANEALMPLVLEYGDWIIWTFPAFILSSYFTCIIRCDGSPNYVMGAVVAGGVLNVFGDWFLVFPMNLGMLFTQETKPIETCETPAVVQGYYEVIVRWIQRFHLRIFLYCFNLHFKQPNYALRRRGSPFDLWRGAFLLRYVPTYLYRCGTGHSTDCCK